MRRGDFEERSDIFKRKSVEKPGVISYKFLVSLNGGFRVKRNITVVCCIEQRFGCLHYDLTQCFIICHSALDFRSR